MRHLIQELRRRKVFRVAGMYALVSWIIMQIGEVTFPALLLPDWALTLVIVLLIIGFPIAILLSWAFDITPDGIKRDQLGTSESELQAVSVPFPSQAIPIRSKYRNIGLISAGIGVVIIISWFVLPQMGLFGLQATIESNSLAVLNFENLRDIDDKDRLGQILQELIITDLSELKSFKVYSSQRLYDLQNQLGQSDSRSINPSVALEVARMAGAAIMLTGNIIQTDTKTILTSRLIEVDRGTVIKSQRVEGTDMYAMVDELTNKVRTYLNLTNQDIQDIEIPVIEKTSRSMTAFQHYLEGMDLFHEQKFKLAIEHFYEAIAIDSSFSSVYYNLAMAQWWAQSEMKEVTSEQALATLDNFLSHQFYKTTKEKLLAEGTRALIKQNFTEALELFSQLVNFVPDEKDGWYGLGEALFHGPSDLDGAGEAFERVLYLDPNYKLAYRHIFDIYASKKQFEEGKMKAVQYVSLFPDSHWGPFYMAMMTDGTGDHFKAAELYMEAIKAYPDFDQSYKNLSYICYNYLSHGEGLNFARELISMYPRKSSPYKLMGRLYNNVGDHGAALEAFENGLLLKPDDHSITLEIGYTYQLMGLYATAKEKYQGVRESVPDQHWQRSCRQMLSGLYDEQGKINQTLQLFEEEIRAVQDLGANQKVQVLIRQAFHYAMISDFDRALEILDSSIGYEPVTELLLNIYLIKGLVFTLQGDRERLDQIVRLVESIFPRGEKKQAGFSLDMFYHALLFQKQFLAEEYQMALEEYNLIGRKSEIPDYFLYQKAVCYLRLGEFEQALATTEKMQKSSLTRDARPFAYPRSFYLRGLIYEALGNLSQARQNYQKLVNIWKDADVNLLDRRDVLDRLERIYREIG